ncbi:MAG: hypothetical protein KDI36_13615 [Pseudomonadales bacterium]|nr:hypothetical protein [Pseudomonadales bacterium]
MNNRLTRNALTLLTMIIALGGCRMSGPVLAPTPEAMPVELQQLAYPLQPGLNISISVFDNLQQDETGMGRLYAPIREVEASYLPVILRDTLFESGAWGAVRVAPVTDTAAELQISGTIQRSTALELSLHIQARDSLGNLWLDRDYQDVADASSYEPGSRERYPFRNLFNRIANDLLLVRQATSKAQANNVLRGSMLRYAISLAPQAFSDYLVSNDAGLAEVAYLPAANDPIYQRVRQIRESEYLFTDVINEQYDAFYQDLQKVYPFWQRYSYELLAFNNRIAADGSMSGRKARSGSWDATEDVYKTFREYKLNVDELRELVSAFRSESRDTVTELEGNIIELNGPLKKQYQQWRDILRRMYAAERGE